MSTFNSTAMNTQQKLLKTTVLLLGIALFSAVQISAQDAEIKQTKVNKNKFQSNFQVGLNGGTSLFFGDIKQYQYWPTANYVSERNLGYGITVNYMAKPSITLRLQGMYGQLSGTRREWNTYFQNDYIETNINALIDLNNLFGKYRSDRFLSVYGTIGIGLMQYNTAVKVLNTNEVIKKVGHGYGSGIGGRTLQGVMMFGMGLNFNVNNNWDIQFETSNRMMDSDMLDGQISGYPLDVYNYTSLGVTYRFGFLKNKYEEEIPNEVLEPELAYVPVVVEEPEPEIEEEEVVPVVVPVAIDEDLLAEDDKPLEKPEMEYRVQILAKFNGPLSINYISTSFLIPKYELKEEIYNGHFIYTVGSFKTYNEARSKRNELRTLYGITDAFIVVFDEGSRLDKFPEIK